MLLASEGRRNAFLLVFFVGKLVIHSLSVKYVMVGGSQPLRRVLRALVEQDEFGHIPAIAIYVKV